MVTPRCLTNPHLDLAGSLLPQHCGTVLSEAKHTFDFFLPCFLEIISKSQVFYIHRKIVTMVWRIFTHMYPMFSIFNFLSWYISSNQLSHIDKLVLIKMYILFRFALSVAESHSGCCNMFDSQGSLASSWL